MTPRPSTPSARATKKNFVRSAAEEALAVFGVATKATCRSTSPGSRLTPPACACASLRPARWSRTRWRSRTRRGSVDGGPRRSHARIRRVPGPGPPAVFEEVQLCLERQIKHFAHTARHRACRSRGCWRASTPAMPARARRSCGRLRNRVKVAGRHPRLRKHDRVMKEVYDLPPSDDTIALNAAIQTRRRLARGAAARAHRSGFDMARRLPPFGRAGSPRDGGVGRRASWQRRMRISPGLIAILPVSRMGDRRWPLGASRMPITVGRLHQSMANGLST
jgi:hypothetical protein